MMARSGCSSRVACSALLDVAVEPGLRRFAHLGADPRDDHKPPQPEAYATDAPLAPGAKASAERAEALGWC